MLGVRVFNIPPKLSVQLLKSEFDSATDNKIDKIYYPLLNNDAVIILKNSYEVAKVLSKSEISSGTTRFQVKPLPHQIYSTISILLEEEVAALVLATDEYRDVLQENGIKIFTTQSNGVGFKGNWFELEWAWNYLHGILDRQYHIQENLVKQKKTASGVHLVNGVGSGEISYLTRRHDQESRLVNESTGLTSKSPNPSVHQIAETRHSSRRDTESAVKDLDRGSGSNYSSSQIAETRQSSRRDTENALKDYDRGSGSNYSSSKRISRNSPPDSHIYSSALGAVGGENLRSDVNDDEVAGLDANRSLGKSGYSDKDSLDDCESYNSRHDTQSGHQRLFHDANSSLSYTESSYLSQATSNRKISTRKSRSEDADQTFENFASLKFNDNSDSLTYQKNSFLTNRGSVQTGEKNSIDRRQQSQYVDDSYTRKSLGHSEVNENMTSLQNSKLLQNSTSLTKFHYKFDDGLEIEVSCNDIVKVKVDCIVNGANSELLNWSGVARSVEKAAGPEIKNECAEYIKKYGELPVTEVMHTKAYGKLQHLKCVLHTVGPIYIKERWEQCIQTLTKTFYNCLKYGNEIVMAKSIAFPFISTGIFDVPVEYCVEAFLDAVVLFISENENSSFLRKILFVNDDPEIVCLAIVMIKQRLDKTFEKLLQEALKKKYNSQKLQTSVSRRKSREYEKKPSARRSSSMTRVDTGRVNNGEQIGGNKPVIQKDPMSTNKSLNGSSSTSPVSFRRRSGSLDRNLRTTESDKRSTTSLTRPSSACGSKAMINGDHVPRKVASLPHFSASLEHKIKRQIPSTQSYGSQKPVKAHHSPGHQTFESETNQHLQNYDSTSNHKARLANHGADNKCAICLCSFTNPKTLKECKHTFCRSCIDHAFKHKPVCPECGMIYGQLKGDQPSSGKMTWINRRDLQIPGYDCVGAIEITYDFPPGKQEGCHPNPGKRYSGIHRQAYLPNNAEGCEVLSLLKKAFDSGLIFTIGQSHTTGAEDVLRWNDIHHKTNIYSPEYGYPDPGYLKRVKEELAAKGITS